MFKIICVYPSLYRFPHETRLMTGRQQFDVVSSDMAVYLLQDLSQNLIYVVILVKYGRPNMYILHSCITRVTT